MVADLKPKTVVAVLVLVHLLANVWHGNAHSKLDIWLTPEKNAFFFVVALLAPVVGAGLMWTLYAKIGLWMFTISMVGSLLFATYHHYVLVSPDNIGHLPAGSPDDHYQFVVSAGVLALVDLGSALYGAYSLGSRAAARA